MRWGPHFPGRGLLTSIPVAIVWIALRVGVGWFELDKGPQYARVR